MSAFTLATISAQNNNRYSYEIFSTYNLQSDVKYCSTIDMNGKPIDLFLDVYSPPLDDAIKLRPMIIYFHGGGFKNGDKNQKMLTTWLSKFAKQGYVCASANYRLGVAQPQSNEDYFEALYRGVQDGINAVKFFKKNAKLYGVDTSQIFIAGQSAGSKIAIHMAYMNQNEVPAFANISKLGLLEEADKNSSYSSKVAGVLNNWGCIINYKWINKGDVPIYNVHGVDDKTVPYDSSFDYHGMKYGSKIIYNRAKEMGIKTDLLSFSSTGHTLDNDAVKQDSAFNAASAWLYKIIKKID